MVLKRKVTITPFNLKRTLHIYLPKGYKTSNKSYPVFYVYDGHNLFNDHDATYGKSWGLKDYFDNNKIEMIIVGMECNHQGNMRLCEYSPYSFTSRHFGKVIGLGKEYMDWLVGELKPYIDQNFRTKKNRNNTFIGGSSMGGLMALWSISKYNQFFSRAACLSPFIHKSFNKFNDDLDYKLRAPTKVYISYGSNEYRNKKDLAIATHNNLMAANVLIKNRAEVYINHVVDGMHNEASWEKEIPCFMNYLFK